MIFTALKPNEDGLEVIEINVSITRSFRSLQDRLH